MCFQSFWNLSHSKLESVFKQERCSTHSVACVTAIILPRYPSIVIIFPTNLPTSSVNQLVSCLSRRPQCGAGRGRPLLIHSAVYERDGACRHNAEGRNQTSYTGANDNQLNHPELATEIFDRLKIFSR